MEDIKWKKDETPYIIFTCSKCHHYIYVKSIQKTKKCARCGYVHKVSKIMERSEIIKGISNAVELVKKKQNDLAIKELGSEPEFRTLDDFKINRKVNRQKDIIDSDSNDDIYYGKFKTMLYDLSKTYKSFPYYVIEIMAENKGIPHSEVKLLTRKLQRQGFLIQVYGENSYQIKV